jgi:hypothetical protein
MLPAAELMARESISLREALTRLRVSLASDEVAKISRRASFQKLVRNAQNTLYQEIAGDPSYSRRAVIGKMLWMVDRMADSGEFRDAVEGLLKVARVEGWLSDATSVNVFNALTDQQLQELKKRAAERVVAN